MEQLGSIDVELTAVDKAANYASGSLVTAVTATACLAQDHAIIQTGSLIE